MNLSIVFSGAICSKALPGAVSVEGIGGCGMMFRNDEDFKDSMMVFRKFMVSHLVSVTKHGRAPDASELTLKLDIEFPDREKLYVFKCIYVHSQVHLLLLLLQAH